MPHTVRRILLMQLPVPPPGMQAMEGNVPLAAAFLKMFARRQGLERDFEIEIFPPKLANTLGDQQLLHAVLQQEPDLIGLTCYVWNIERSLWLAEQIKRTLPEVKVVLGGPEITADNRWVLEHAAVDYAIFGEGEATFVEMLRSFRDHGDANGFIAGLWRKGGAMPEMREPLDSLDAVSSPYLEGILDARENKTMLLETVRGCRFRCKYCYYSKRNAVLRFLPSDAIEANLRHAVECGASEVYLLDPTINQRTDFADLLRLLARCNAERRLTFSGELRAEGIDAESAKLLRAANFTELEIGLQSVEPLAHRLMGRPVNLEAWQRGVRILMAEGIRVRLDLILGLPGDTVESIRRGIDFLAAFRPDAEIQIFNLSILPGTDFRRDADALGLKYQMRPPYYVLRTPTLDVERMYRLMEEAQQALDIEFDAPALPFENEHRAGEVIPAHQSESVGNRCDGITPAARFLMIDLDNPAVELPQANDFDLVTTLLLRSANFSQVESLVVRVVTDAVRTNPHITLQIVLEPRREPTQLRAEMVSKIVEACYSSTSYLDRYYSLHPGYLLGAKRVFVLLPLEERTRIDRDWIHEIGECANILWHGDESELTDLSELEEFEHVVSHLNI
jgi:radical SAM superfamily enzyme YgiQ (UPF0313 family)